MKASFCALLTCSILLALPFGSLADIYKYRDANGRLTFVDDESKIPSQFRDNATTMTEAEGSPVVYDSPDLDSTADSYLELEKAGSTALKKQLH